MIYAVVSGLQSGVYKEPEQVKKFTHGVKGSYVRNFKDNERDIAEAFVLFCSSHKWQEYNSKEGFNEFLEWYKQSKESINQANEVTQNSSQEIVDVQETKQSIQIKAEKVEWEIPNGKASESAITMLKKTLEEKDNSSLENCSQQVAEDKQKESSKDSVQQVAEVKQEEPSDNPVQQVAEDKQKESSKDSIQQVAEHEQVEPNSDKIRVNVNPTDWEIFTDGSFFPFSQKAGYCAILILGKKDDMPLQISGGVLDLDSSYQVEEYAIFKALEKLDTLRPYGDVHFYCDCLPLVKSLNIFLKDENAIDVNSIDDIMKEILQYLKYRDKSKKYEFHHVPGHSGIKFNEQCDKIARLENELL